MRFRAKLERNTKTLNKDLETDNEGAEALTKKGKQKTGGKQTKTGSARQNATHEESFNIKRKITT